MVFCKRQLSKSNATNKENGKVCLLVLQDIQFIEFTDYTRKIKMTVKMCI